MKTTSAIAVTFALTLFGSGCFSKTNIYAKPVGAEVVLDGNRTLGPAPVQLEEQVWLWTKHSLTVRADGYQSQTVQLRNTGLNYGNAVICLCSLGLVFPVLMVSEFPKQVVVELTPTAPESNAQASLTHDAKVRFR